jgi:hypothetical protein
MSFLDEIKSRVTPKFSCKRISKSERSELRPLVGCNASLDGRREAAEG